MQSDIIQIIIDTLDEHKAINIQSSDVTKLTDITDTIIICTATSNRHARTLADKILEACKKQGTRHESVEGADEGQWILVDFSDCIVHIMTETTREFYNLEKLWVMTESKRQEHTH